MQGRQGHLPRAYGCVPLCWFVVIEKGCYELVNIRLGGSLLLVLQCLLNQGSRTMYNPVSGTDKSRAQTNRGQGMIQCLIDVGHGID